MRLIVQWIVVIVTILLLAYMGRALFVMVKEWGWWWAPILVLATSIGAAAIMDPVGRSDLVAWLTSWRR